jgi:hypothetical protein
MLFGYPAAAAVTMPSSALVVESGYLQRSEKEKTKLDRRQGGASLCHVFCRCA